MNVEGFPQFSSPEELKDFAEKTTQDERDTWTEKEKELRIKEAQMLEDGGEYHLDKGGALSFRFSDEQIAQMKNGPEDPSSKKKKRGPYAGMSPEKQAAYREKQRGIQLGLSPELQTKRAERMRTTAPWKSSPNVLGADLVHESVPNLATQFLERIQRPDRQEEPEKYHGYEGGLLFMRYYSRFRKKHDEEHNAPITSRSIQKFLPPEAKEEIKIPWLTYADAVEIRRELGQIDDSYNTEDGEFRWLIDHGFSDVNLSVFWTLVPHKLKERMTEWRYMSPSPEKASLVYAAAKDVDLSYNTTDGMARWLKDSKISEAATLQQIMYVLPKETKRRMTEWQFHLTDAKRPKSVEELYEFSTSRDYVLKSLQDRYKFGNGMRAREIANFMWRAQLSKAEIDTSLQVAFNNANALILELRRAYNLKNKQAEINMQQMHELYAFAQERLSLTPVSTYVILRLKHITIRGVRNIVDFGSQKKPGTQSFSMHAHPEWDPDGKTLEDKLGKADPEYARIQSKEILQLILKENHLESEQVKLLEQVIAGADLDEAGYETLASAIKKHPELMELLGE